MNEKAMARAAKLAARAGATRRAEAGLSAPLCEGGYPHDQLERELGEQAFNRLMIWMEGQTQMLCEGRSYSHETKEYGEACGGVAHGPVVYVWDVERWLAAGPIID